VRVDLWNSFMWHRYFRFLVKFKEVCNELSSSVCEREYKRRVEFRQHKRGLLFLYYKDKTYVQFHIHSSYCARYKKVVIFI
jgi:hypothetical protein